MSTESNKQESSGDDNLLDKMIERLHERGSTFGKGSAYDDLHAICRELDARRLEALRERNEARAFGEKAAKLYNERLVLRCAFCGMEYPDGTLVTKNDRLTAHVRVCPDHPVKKLVAVLDDIATMGLCLDDGEPEEPTRAEDLWSEVSKPRELAKVIVTMARKASEALAAVGVRHGE